MYSVSLWLKSHVVLLKTVVVVVVVVVNAILGGWHYGNALVLAGTDAVTIEKLLDWNLAS